MSVDQKKFADDCIAYGDALGKLRERRRITEHIRSVARVTAMPIASVLYALATEIDAFSFEPELPTPLRPTSREPQSEFCACGARYGAEVHTHNGNAICAACWNEVRAEREEHTP